VEAARRVELDLPETGVCSGPGPVAEAPEATGCCGQKAAVHVVEHAAALGLTPEQRARAEELRRDMEGEARAIGARIVASEEELDALFARGEADAGRLAALTAALGALGGRLREAHLAAHIGMREALSPDQRAAYARLRGYTPG
jgi:Spy/CpxP family protein refolding chaperone